MKKIIYILPLLLLITSSCDKWLDKSSKDKWGDAHAVFNSEAAFRNAVNGIYTDLRSDALYGGVAGQRAVEILGQQYNTSGKLADYASFNYSSSAVKSDIRKMFLAYYALIYKCNDILELLESGRDVVFTPRAKEVLMGELHAIRAMLHFDLLRMFAAPYVAASNDIKIAYVNSTSQKGVQESSANIMSKVIADLKKAESLLITNDPIVTGENIDSYLGLQGMTVAFRKWKLNYYAAVGIRARAELYAGNNSEAAKAAKIVIDATKAIGGSGAITNVWNTPSSYDKAFSGEHLFGVAGDEVMVDNTAYLYTENGVTLNNRVNEFFAANGADTRKAWVSSSTLTPKYGSASGIGEVDSYSKTLFQRIPMIKIGEIYLIAAETLDFNTAKSLMCEFKLKRTGIDISSSLATQEDVNNLIAKEYTIEFLGESQLFFYYKRLNKTVIDSHVYGEKVNMTAAKYTLPLPEGAF